MFKNLASLVPFLGLMLLAVYGAFRVQMHQNTLPDGKDTFSAFLPYMLNRQKIWLGLATIATLAGGLGFGFIVLLFA